MSKWVGRVRHAGPCRRSVAAIRRWRYSRGGDANDVVPGILAFLLVHLRFQLHKWLYFDEGVTRWSLGSCSGAARRHVG